MLAAAWWAGMPNATMTDLSEDDLAALTVQEINDNALYSSQRGDTVAVLAPVDPRRVFEEAYSGMSLAVVEDPSRGGTPKHVYGLRFSDRELGLFDPAAPALVQVMQAAYYLEKAEGRDLAYYALARSGRPAPASARAPL